MCTVVGHHPHDPWGTGDTAISNRVLPLSLLRAYPPFLSSVRTYIYISRQPPSLSFDKLRQNVGW